MKSVRDESNLLSDELERLLRRALELSSDVSDEVESLMREAALSPVESSQVERLVRRVSEKLRSSGNPEAIDAARDLEDHMEELIDLARTRPLRAKETDRVALLSRDGIKTEVVRPTPTFHEREIPMVSGFVRLLDIKLWPENHRLDLHVSQFRQRHHRLPTDAEILQIMLSELPLPGVTPSDQFKIQELARSIANNGVRKPPILAIDGTLLDGNRRVAACHYIFNSPEFDSEQKARIEWLFVWQLTEHSGPDDEERVVVSLNFESDHKEPWPEYVKAMKVFEEWQEMLSLEPRSPSKQRSVQLKRELSQKFALGPAPTIVTRYIKMVQWAQDFEEHEVLGRGQDEFEVRHKAAEYFQYFDELGKGTTKSDGVASVLGRDDVLKHLVFDLLFQDKFINWRQIRELRYVGDNSDAVEALKAARDEKDLEHAQDKVANALASARSISAEVRETGANIRIEKFVEWFEQLPLRAFRDQVKPKNVEGLLRALKLAKTYASESVGEDRVGEILDGP